VAGPVIQRYKDKIEEERQAVLAKQEEEAAKRRAAAEARKKAEEDAKKAEAIRQAELATPEGGAAKDDEDMPDVEEAEK